jgi:hypothetical protein
LFSFLGGISLQITLLRGREDLEILSEDTQWDMGAVNLRCLCFGMAGVRRIVFSGNLDEESVTNMELLLL